MLTYAIGDIHGCHEKLEKLLAACRDFAGSRRARYVFLGDHIDRGPNSRGVLESIIASQRSNPTSVIALLGNHEDLLLQSLEFAEDVLEQWLADGGDATLESYNVRGPDQLPAEHLSWLTNLPTHFDDGIRLFVHAGIRPGVPLAHQTRHDVLWIREPFLSSEADHGRYVVHGHTPIRGGEPDLRPNRANLDTGAVYGRKLTAAVFDEQEREPIKLLSA